MPAAEQLKWLKIEGKEEKTGFTGSTGCQGPCLPQELHDRRYFGEYRRYFGECRTPNME